MIRCAEPALGELRQLVTSARAPRLRGMRRWAEDELILPTGPYQGRKFRVARQPFTRLWLEAIDSGSWQRFAALGPVQSGKSWAAFVVPTLYHLFEVRETVICGVPHMELAEDKWSLDLLPAINASRYRELLPTRGAGSRGGKTDAVTFRNGATLKFMSGGGGDQKRSYFTSRVVVITEADKFDRAGDVSREADPITQLERRTNAWGARRRIYLECTVSVEAGRIWQEYQHGTRSRIALPCPHCRKYVTPEREHLHGWQDAGSEIEAAESAAFFCPACGEAWDEDERHQANAAAVLLHGEQHVNRRGRISGDPPRTYTLGMRWTCANNLLTTAGDVGAAEWRAVRAANEESAARDLLQFWWAQPAEPEIWDETPLDRHAIRERAGKYPQGMVPEWCQAFTVGIDLRKRYGHWIAPAWAADGSVHVVDYGVFDVPSDDLGVERALFAALLDFAERVQTGWVQETGGSRVPDQVWVDAGYQSETVYRACRQIGDRFRPCVGRGATQQRAQWYNRPKKTGAVVKFIGEQYHLSRIPAERLHLVEINADYWKSFVHERLTTPPGAAGACTLYEAPARTHTSLSHHLTAEKQVEQFVAGKGMVRRWETLSKANHWFDAFYLAAAAAHFVGVQLVRETVPQTTRPRPAAAERRSPATGPDRPYMVTER